MPSSFTLGTHFEGFIKQQVNSGRYASASEVVRDSLRLLEEQDAMRQARLDALRAEIEHGATSGVGKVVKVFEILSESELAALQAK